MFMLVYSERVFWYGEVSQAIDAALTPRFCQPRQDHYMMKEKITAKWLLRQSGKAQSLT